MKNSVIALIALLAINTSLSAKEIFRPLLNCSGEGYTYRALLRVGGYPLVFAFMTTPKGSKLFSSLSYTLKQSGSERGSIILSGNIAAIPDTKEKLIMNITPNLKENNVPVDYTTVEGKKINLNCSFSGLKDNPESQETYVDVVYCIGPKYTFSALVKSGDTQPKFAYGIMESKGNRSGWTNMTYELKKETPTSGAMILTSAEQGKIEIKISPDYNVYVGEDAYFKTTAGGSIYFNCQFQNIE